MFEISLHGVCMCTHVFIKPGKGFENVFVEKTEDAKTQKQELLSKK